MSKSYALSLPFLFVLGACSQQDTGSQALDVNAPATPSACTALESTDARDGAGFITVTRCSTKVQDADGGAYDQLRLELRGTNGPFGRSGSPLAMSGNVSVYVKLNSQAATYPMACRTTVSGSNGAYGQCVVTIANMANDAIRAEEGPVVDSPLFAFSRQDGGRVLNAWDIELAFVDQAGQWDSRDGQNYHARFAERTVGSAVEPVDSTTFATVCGDMRTYLPGGVTNPSVPFRNAVLDTADGTRYSMQLNGTREYNGAYCVSGNVKGTTFVNISVVSPF